MVKSIYSELIQAAQKSSSPEPLIALAMELPAGKAQVQALSITNTILSQEDTIKTLRARCARFQRILDDNAQNVINDIKNLITDASSAYGAQDYYDVDWFTEQPYSDLKIQQIAQALINATDPYLSNKNKFWVNLTNGDFTALERDDSDNATPIAKRKRLGHVEL